MTQQIKEQLEEVIKKLGKYTEHSRDCILSQFEAGEPTEDGGYRQKFNGKWYQSRPIDKTPKCDCGLDNTRSLIADEVLKVVEEVVMDNTPKHFTREYRDTDKMRDDIIKSLSNLSPNMDAEKDCEECGGTGEVSVMERVYPNEPHMAPIGSEICPDCLGSGRVDVDEE